MAEAEPALGIAAHVEQALVVRLVMAEAERDQVPARSEPPWERCVDVVALQVRAARAAGHGAAPAIALEHETRSAGTVSASSRSSSALYDEQRRLVELAPAGVLSGPAVVQLPHLALELRRSDGVIGRGSCDVGSGRPISPCRPCPATGLATSRARVAVVVDRLVHRAVRQLAREVGPLAVVLAVATFTASRTFENEALPPS